MSQYAFGAGTLFGRRTDVTPATPVKFGAIQGVTVDIAFSVKELYGQNQFPLAVGRGTGKVTGKAQFGQFNAQAFNDLFFGQANVAVGSIVTVSGEAATVTSNAVTVAGNATFLRDLGVVLSSDSSVYARVTAGPVGQQYTCNESTGVYSFNSSQNNVAVKVSYQKNDAANGKLVTLTNQLLGSAPQFMMVLTEVFQAKKLTLTLNACMSSKLALATKLEDFIIPDFDFSAFTDSSDTLGTLSLDE